MFVIFSWENVSNFKIYYITVKNVIIAAVSGTQTTSHPWSSQSDAWI